MAQVSPFRAMRYTPSAGALNDLVCPPYDIINDTQRQALLARSDYNVIRLEKPTDYQAAAQTLQSWLDNGIVAVDELPSFTVYQEEFDDRGTLRRVTGVIGDVTLEPFDAGVVLPHEETLPKARGDRHALMSATFCNFSQIYCLYRDPAQTLTPLIHKQLTRQPDTQFTTEDGVTHRFWRIDDPTETAAIQAAFADKTLYIADGHHRYTTALEFHQEHPGDATARVMTMLCDMADEGLVIWPTHRLLHDLPDFSPADVLTKLHQQFEITLVESTEHLEAQLAERAHTVAFYSGGGHYALLTLRDPSELAKAMPDKSAAYQGLDVALLHSMILEPIFNIGAAELAAQTHVAYTRYLPEALSAVDSGTAQCAFLLNTTHIEQMADVSLAGERMPQKSTYFYPKLITGAVMKRLSP